jgi:hypothetical protein
MYINLYKGMHALEISFIGPSWLHHEGPMIEVSMLLQSICGYKAWGQSANLTCGAVVIEYTTHNPLFHNFLIANEPYEQFLWMDTNDTILR